MIEIKLQQRGETVLRYKFIVLPTWGSRNRRTWNIGAVSFNHVNELDQSQIQGCESCTKAALQSSSSKRTYLIDGNVFAQNDFGTGNLVLFANETRHFSIDALGLFDEFLKTNAPGLLLDEFDIRRLLIDTNAKGKELLLDDFLVRHGFGGIQDDENQIASPGGGNDLPAAAASVGGALNDPGQIEDLNARAAVLHGPGNAREGGEFVGGGFAFGAGEGSQ
jgi:hypothetical protein